MEQPAGELSLAFREEMPHRWDGDVLYTSVCLMVRVQGLRGVGSK